MNRRDIIKGIAVAPLVAAGVALPVRGVVVTELMIDARGCRPGNASLTALRYEVAWLRKCNAQISRAIAAQTNALSALSLKRMQSIEAEGRAG